MPPERRAVLSLAVAQALFQTVTVLNVTVGGLAGLMLAPDQSLATLPIACGPLGNAIATVPASLLMGRIGRRPGFVTGTLLGAAGAAFAAWAMFAGSFALLCVGTTLLGAYQGFAQFYRFAAAEAADEAFRSRAISFVMAGGVVAAIAGPNLGAATRDLAGDATFAGSYLTAVGLSLVSALLLTLTRIPDRTQTDGSPEPPRPLPQIMRQPRFIAAVAGAAAGAGVMVLIMTATPISMVGHQHGVSDAALVIQWHVLGMFVPSFFTGSLIRRFGVTRIMLIGVVLLLGHVAIATSGVALLNFLSGLVLLGVGWNFLYVGGSTLLTETYRPSERARIQALNDFLIVGVVAAGSFSAGALVDQFGWRGLNLVAVAPLLIAALAIAGAAIAGGRSARLARRSAT